MRIRNLAIFIVDDRPVATTVRGLFEVNGTPYGWMKHCLEAATGEKQLAYDLMSVDVNYSEDRTDPAWAPDSKYNCFGFVHALAALARRKSYDDEYNITPFEWEIRSASPQQVRGDLWAVRLYGLLRSLAAQPLPDEDLWDCIKREHLEKWHKPIAADRGGSDVGYAQLFIEDVAEQLPQDSNFESIIGRLLPGWRTKLLEAVKEGDIRLHLKTVEKCVKHLRGRKTISATDPLDAELCIPFSSATGRFAYGINLFSVLADLLDREQRDVNCGFSLDTRTNFEALRIDDVGYSGQPVNIVEWFDYLRIRVSGIQTPAGLDREMLLVADKLEECLAVEEQHSRTEALQALFTSFAREYTRIGMLYILLVARRQVLGISHTRHADLESAYGYIAIGPQTISRPIRSQTAVFPQVGGPDKFAREICNAMTGCNHRLGVYWQDWIRPGLTLWYQKYKNRIDPSGKNLAQFAPGLFESIPR